MIPNTLSRSSNRRIPCRILRGVTEYQGTALSVDVGSVVLLLPAERSEPVPSVGEQVRLELSLAENSGPVTRCLTAKARVARVTGRPDGSSEMILRFRKAAFADHANVGPEPKAARAKWAM